MTKQNKEHPFLIAFTVTLVMLAIGFLMVGIAIPSIPNYAWVRIVCGVVVVVFLVLILRPAFGGNRRRAFLTSIAFGWVMAVSLLEKSIEHVFGSFAGWICTLTSIVLVLFVMLELRRSRESNNDAVGNSK